ncbi:hypothetical protein DID80_05535 [Candidatus Marinamargulisbacteria bacterium SCGC AAA071-K20]|nr:hypothetical protein DID80_05535 [Candidatus Marinamargulisbacteria bacterium SCGC AAA071-K20]
MKILLTGANGYIGYRLLPLLARLGHTIVCCVRDKNRFITPDIFHSQISVIQADFSQKNTLSNIPRYS